MRYEQIIRDALIRMRDEGKTRRQAAKELGLSYQTIVGKVNDLGIEWPNATWSNLVNTERNKQILERFEAGLTLEDIGAEFGITRERVRQITNKMGATPRMVQRDEAEVELAEKIAAAPPMSAKELARKFGIKPNKAREVAAVSDALVLKRDSETTARLAEMAERVKAGESITGVGSAMRGMLARYCRENGIKSLAPTQWSVDPEMRKRVAAEMRADGKTWEEIARVIAKNEGVRGIVPKAIEGWVTRHAPEIMAIKPPKPERAKRQPRPEKEPRQPRQKRPVVPIEVREGIKETAIANYGKVPASRLAAQLGVSRNSIIGHWFRARQSGEIAA